jgi:hypothetical protein
MTGSHARRLTLDACPARGVPACASDIEGLAPAALLRAATKVRTPT